MARQGGTPHIVFRANGTLGSSRRGVGVLLQDKLATIRTVYTAIYIVMAAATFTLLCAGITGRDGVWLSVALALAVGGGKIS